MDLVAADIRGGSRVLADIMVADPTRSTAVMVTAVERGHAARLAAEMKVGKYGDHFSDDNFVPLAVEIYGCLSVGQEIENRRPVGIQADLLLSV
jgi:hypothetical protein